MEGGDLSAPCQNPSMLRSLSGPCSLSQMESDYHSPLFIPTSFFPLCDSFVLVFAFVARSQLAQAFQVFA